MHFPVGIVVVAPMVGRRRAPVLEVMRRGIVARVRGRGAVWRPVVEVAVLGRMLRRRGVAPVVRGPGRGSHPGGRGEMLLLLLWWHP